MTTPEQIGQLSCEIQGRLCEEYKSLRRLQDIGKKKEQPEQPEAEKKEKKEGD